MGFDKIKKRSIYRWLMWICIGFVFTETIYQFYLRSKWVDDTYYNWEDYAFKRNKERIKYLENYFSQSKNKYFLYSQNPSEGNLKKLPVEIQETINDLKKDLISGIDILGNRKHFEINFQMIKNNQYILYLYTGATFKGSNNGYNFDAIVTNADSSYHQGYEITDVSTIFINKQHNKKYRSAPIILRYNCNSYDLLIFRLFR